VAGAFVGATAGALLDAFFAYRRESAMARAGARLVAADLSMSDHQLKGVQKDERWWVSLHLCRHTFASLMIDAGANPKAIQEFMGHSKIQTTFDVYGHLLPGSRDEVRERMNAYLRAATRR
jgi:integrase